MAAAELRQRVRGHHGPREDGHVHRDVRPRLQEFDQTGDDHEHHESAAGATVGAVPGSDERGHRGDDGRTPLPEGKDENATEHERPTMPRGHGRPAHDEDATMGEAWLTLPNGPPHRPWTPTTSRNGKCWPPPSLTANLSGSQPRPPKTRDTSAMPNRE